MADTTKIIDFAAAQNLGFAPAVPFEQLNRSHPSYDAKKIANFDALYEGGDKFKARIEEFLIRRKSEGASGATNAIAKSLRNESLENPGNTGEAVMQARSIGGDTYELRKKYAWYESQVAGVIDFIRAATMSSRPLIVATRANADGAVKLVKSWIKSFLGYQPDPDPKVAYWQNLNSDADGRGTSLARCKSTLLQSLLLHARAYIGIRFPSVSAANLYDAESKNAFDAKFMFFGAAEIDDWDYDADGQLCLLRRHVKSAVRAAPTAPLDRTCEQWTYITPQAVLTYSITYANDKPPATNTPVYLSAFDPHSLGEMPVREIPIDIHVMERLAPLVIKLFNRQASITWSLNCTAFALLVIASKSDLQDGFDPDQMALQLEPSATANWVQPSAQGYDPLFKDAELTKASLYEALMAAVLRAVSMASNGRQTEGAKNRDFDAFETFLEIFSEPMKAGLCWAVELAKKIRNEKDMTVIVEGLDNFDIDSIGQILENTTAFLALPGVPDTARRYSLLRVCKAMLKNAPPDVFKESVQELDKATLPPPVPASPAPTQKGVPLSKKSEEPA